MPYYGVDINVPTVYHQRLLADKNFDFTPFWEESIINWLHKNASRLLKANPHCCKFFIGDEEQKGTIASVMPLVDEDVTMFLRTLNEADYREFTVFSSRLIAAGEADTTVSSKLYALQKMDSDNPPDFILQAISDKSIIRVLENLEWSKTWWNTKTWDLFIKRIPTNRIKDIAVEQLPCKTRWHRVFKIHTPVKQTRFRIACTLAKILPVADLHDFISRMSTTATMMDCFSCGEFTAKSKPGYTLHRKNCDARDEYPNALITAATRLVQ